MHKNKTKNKMEMKILKIMFDSTKIWCKKRKQNHEKHMNTKFDWMSSALAAQMYAAQLSSQQQQNMYVIIIKFKQTIKQKTNTYKLLINQLWIEETPSQCWAEAAAW